MFLFGKSEYHGADRGLMDVHRPTINGAERPFLDSSGSVLPAAKNIGIAPIDCIYLENLS